MKKLICTFVIICIFSITCNAGSASAETSVALKNSAVSINIGRQEANRVKALVKSGYRGNYTLKWAKEHDYRESDKVKWVNIKGYSSRTNYLVWVSTAYQRLNVFTGSAGNWNISKTFIIGTGVSGRDTPAGVWKLLGKSQRGWTTSLYTVKPVVNFINGKYGFHSRLYSPDFSKIYDGRIGFPCSHGCIRMYTDDIRWFYENVPVGTTVVVY
jgi:lipoprotein-anchoring transpeptidase ErfK/SrfK